ncbi:AraC family transcriptional regulator [Cupriavidus sp. 2TAF22]|uniref:AraC family transcriptional regulator n=1 Tax=unclassified Cupriavidus TaxID=2640874 RepID=UPI003F8DD0B0
MHIVASGAGTPAPLPVSFAARPRLDAAGTPAPIAQPARHAGARPAARHTHTISVLQLQQILLGARRLGCDIDALLRRAGISPALLQSASARVTEDQFAALMRSMRRVTRDEFWGLLNRPLKPGVFAQSCRALIHCATLEDALRVGLQQYRLHLDDFVPRLQQHAGIATLLLVPRAPATACRLYAESTFAFQAYGVANWLVAQRIPLTGVDLAAPAPERGGRPAKRTDTERVFNTQVRYGQPHTALHFDAGWLRLPVVQDAASLQAFLQDTPRNLLTRYRDDSCLAERIRRHLRCHLDGELPSLEQMAETLRLTPQTLRRRLRDEGRGYQSIKDSLRRDAAIGFLEHTDLPLQQVALRVGFSEPSTFHRAFKKWTGVAPGEYRQRQMMGCAA